MKENELREVITEAVKKAALGYSQIHLTEAKQLIERMEEYCDRQGLAGVIAICGPDGHPIAVHVMDGAYLASFDIAIKKAYTAVALKMSTAKLSELAKPGEDLYGIDKTDGGRICILGGGEPLVLNGHILGGIAVSGGIGAEDIEAARYGASLVQEIWKL